jgi:rubrerythrin
MESYSAREVIEMAVQTEKLGYDFYLKMAEKFREDLEVKGIFEKLALREQVHQKTFAELKTLLGDEEPEKWDEVAPFMKALIESAFFIGKEQSTAHVDHIQDFRGAVGFALAFEKETLLFFHSIRAFVTEKEMIDEIINEETSHIMWLNSFMGRKQ